MKLITIVFFALITACASVAPNPSDQTKTRKETSPIIIGESRIINSAILGEAREVNVWLPPSYQESGSQYPVLYLIDGGLDQDFHHITGLAQLGAVANMFREVIVVGIQTNDRRADLTYPSLDQEHIDEFPTHGHSDQFREFITSEVMSWVNASYRTSGENALIGESLAGLFIVETFLNSPEDFSSYIAISPSMWWDNESLAQNAIKKLRTHTPAERKIYVAIADEGGTMRSSVLSLVNAFKIEKAPGLAWIFSDRPDLEHSTIYHREALEALVWIFERPKEKK